MELLLVGKLVAVFILKEVLIVKVKNKVMKVEVIKFWKIIEEKS